MREEYLISIVVPVFNVEKYLRECVDSIINQTYKKIEIILVDDGSTDNSGRICDQYKDKDERISVIHKENGGLSDARNVGIVASTGSFICFVDSDDYISPYFIEILLKVREENDCDFTLVYDCPSFWDGEERISLATSKDDYKFEVIDSRLALQRMLLQNIATGAPFKLCPREYFDEVKFPKGYLYEDAATTYKLFFKAKKVGIIYSDLYAYRMRRDSIIRQNFNREKMIVKEIYNQILKDERIKEWGLLNDAHSRAFSLVFTVFLQIPKDDKEDKQILWELLRESRRYVLLNNNKYCRKKNKVGAAISYLGMNFTYWIGRKIGQKGSMK